VSPPYILVIEDGRIRAAGLREKLVGLGYVVSGVALSAGDPVERVARERPALVVMGARLTGGADGIAVARAIRSRCGVPVVFLASVADPGTLARAAGSGAVGYLTEPHDGRSLRAMIKRALVRRLEPRLVLAELGSAGVLAGRDVAVIVTDPVNRVRFINPAGEALTGWPEHEAVGRLLADVCPLEDEFGRLPMEDLADLTVRGGSEEELEFPTWLIGRTGQEVLIEGQLRPVLGSGGALLGMALIARRIGRAHNPRPVGRRNPDRPARAQAGSGQRLIGGAPLPNQFPVVVRSRTAAPPPAQFARADVVPRISAAGPRASAVLQRRPAVPDTDPPTSSGA
jgi:CheY-like chemotaxis protein